MKWVTGRVNKEELLPTAQRNADTGRVECDCVTGRGSPPSTVYICADPLTHRPCERSPILTGRYVDTATICVTDSAPIPLILHCSVLI